MSNQTPADPAGSGRPGRPSPPIRLAAFDLDGTLLGPGPELAEDVRQAVRDLVAAGVTVAIVTGRMTVTAERFALEMGLSGHPMITFNGAVAKFVGHVATLWSMPIRPDLGAAVINFLAERKHVPLVFVGGDRVYTMAPGEGAEQYGAISGVAPVFVPSLTDLVLGRRPAGEPGGPPGSPAGAPPGPAAAPPGPAAAPGGVATAPGGVSTAHGAPATAAGAPLPLPPTKIIQVEDPAVMPALFSAAAERFGRELQVTTSYPFFLEFMNKDVTKGRALARICRRLRIGRSEVAAFGDGLNDLEMIQWAGLGVAMGHAPAELREAADVVLDGPPGEAVARFLWERLLS